MNQPLEAFLRSPAQAEPFADHRAMLARRFRLPPMVAYAETPAFERSPRDPPHAAIHCSQCRSSIVVHPAGSGWPPFPKA